MKEVAFLGEGIGCTGRSLDSQSIAMTIELFGSERTYGCTSEHVCDIGQRRLSFLVARSVGRSQESKGRIESEPRGIQFLNRREK